MSCIFTNIPDYHDAKQGLGSSATEGDFLENENHNNDGCCNVLRTS